MTLPKENPTWGAGGAEAFVAYVPKDTKPIIHPLGFLLYSFAGGRNTRHLAVANAHYTMLAVLEMASALIDSVQIRTGGAA